MTRTVWPRASAASRSREVEYRLGLRERMAIFTIESQIREACRRGDCTSTTDEGLTRIYDETLTNCRTTEKHPETHLVASGEREINAETAAVHRQHGAHHRAPLDV